MLICNNYYFSITMSNIGKSSEFRRIDKNFYLAGIQLFIKAMKVYGDSCSCSLKNELQGVSVIEQRR